MMLILLSKSLNLNIRLAQRFRAPSNYSRSTFENQRFHVRRATYRDLIHKFVANSARQQSCNLSIYISCNFVDLTNLSVT